MAHDDTTDDDLLADATEAIARGHGDADLLERLSATVEIQHGKMVDIALIVATAEAGLTPHERAFERIREILAEKRTA